MFIIDLTPGTPVDRPFPSSLSLVFKVSLGAKFVMVNSSIFKNECKLMFRTKTSQAQTRFEIEAEVNSKIDIATTSSGLRLSKLYLFKGYNYLGSE